MGSWGAMKSNVDSILFSQKVIILTMQLLAINLNRVPGIRGSGKVLNVIGLEG